ncbi:MAG: DUF5723 family protein [Chitinophagales bacterium]
MRKFGLFVFLTGLVYARTFATAEDTVAQKSSASAYQYVPNTSIFGVFDPLSVQMYDKKFALIPYSDLYTASNCFSVKFIQNFFGSGFITDEMKDLANSKLSDLNTIGVDFYSGLWMMMRTKDNDNAYFIAGVDYNFEESGQFTRDLFHIVFYGNYDLQDQTADLTDSKFSLTSVMEYKVGFMRVFDAHYNKVTFGITGGLVQGLSGLDIKTKYGTLYTADDGRYIDLDYDFSIKTSGENKPSLSSFTGAGFSFDAYAQLYLQGPEITINAMIQDVGAVFWSNGPLKISADSTLHFEGIEVNNFFAATDETAAGNSDSLLEILGVVKEENVFSQALPSRLFASATKKIGNDAYFTLGTHFMFNTPYKPLVFVQAGRSFTPMRFTASVNAHTGGYGGFNVGLDLSKEFGSFLNLRIGSNSILGVVAPDSFTGAAGYATAVVRF